MSAPKTDPEKQTERHRVPLLGLRGVVLWALVLLILLVVFVTVRGNTPGEEEQPTAAPGEVQATE